MRAVAGRAVNPQAFVVLEVETTVRHPAAETCQGTERFTVYGHGG